MSDNPVRDIEEAIRMSDERMALAPCRHPYIMVSLSDLDGRPCNPRCMTCGKPFFISSDELDEMLRAQQAEQH